MCAFGALVIKYFGGGQGKILKAILLFDKFDTILSTTID